MTPTDSLNDKLHAYRTEQAARRARAFVDCPDFVLGTPCRPMTPKTWSALHAMGSRFVTAGGEPGLGDVRTFIWIHSPLFTTSRLLRRPARWLALLRFNGYLNRPRGGIDWACAVLALASSEIDRILSDVLADAPTGGGGRPASACLEAQLIHLFAEAYGWTDEKTSGTPLARLFQLRRNFDGTEQDDAGERRIRFEHLAARNAELKAQRAAVSTPQK